MPLDGTTLIRTYQTFYDRDDVNGDGVRFVCSSPIAENGIELRVSEQDARHLETVLRQTARRRPASPHSEKPGSP